MEGRMNWSETFRRAAEIIRTNGLAKGVFFDSDAPGALESVPVCGVGAIHLAMRKSFEWGCEGTIMALDASQSLRALATMQDGDNELSTTPSCSIPNFNDDDDTTAGDVEMLLLLLAEAMEDEEARDAVTTSLGALLKSHVAADAPALVEVE